MKSSPLFGIHASIAGGAHNALTEAKEVGCDCVQLFVANQRQWKHPPLTDQQIELFTQTRRETAISPIVAHSSYLINLAAANRETRDKSIAALADEFDRCNRLGIEYLVLHPGAHVGRGEQVGMDKIVSGLETVIDRCGTMSRILLETTAGQGECLGHRFEELSQIIERVNSGKNTLGVCLDTCHILAAGYDFRTPAGYKQVMKEFDDAIGIDKLLALHINDSKTDLGSRVDRHEHIGKGFVGSKGFTHFLTDGRLRGLPFILETPKGKSPAGKDMDQLNLANLRRLAK